MTALAPLNSAEALPLLHKAGVGEVYMGFHDDGWDRRFGDAELNRMSGFGREANPFDFAQMCEQLKRTRDLGMHGFVCFNAASYTPGQCRFIASEYLPRLAEAEAHGVILSSQALLSEARRCGLAATISTVAGIYNERLAAHYRDAGATRIILPRDLSIAEILGIIEHVPNVEYEVFLMRNGCLFSDSHCLGYHQAGHPSLCMSLRTGTCTIALAHPSDDAAADEAFMVRAWENEQLLNVHYHRRTCGLCALWRFERAGVAAYKVVGRGDDAADLCADAALVMRNEEIARTCSTEAEYLARMERPREPETLCGYEGLSCYYPELEGWKEPFSLA